MPKEKIYTAKALQSLLSYYTYVDVSIPLEKLIGPAGKSVRGPVGPTGDPNGSVVFRTIFSDFFDLNNLYTIAVFDKEPVKNLLNYCLKNEVDNSPAVDCMPTPPSFSGEGFSVNNITKRVFLPVEGKINGNDIYCGSFVRGIVNFTNSSYNASDDTEKSYIINNTFNILIKNSVKNATFYLDSFQIGWYSEHVFGWNTLALFEYSDSNFLTYTEAKSSNYLKWKIAPTAWQKLPF